MAYTRRGERAPNAKLTQAQAEEARRQYAAGGVTLKELARAYGCSYSVMQRLINHRSYQQPHE